ncbi:MAG: ATP-binding protein [Nitrospirae bacterium]|nr:ATP-binding protein [Nitrospirota bacterium]
MKIRDKLFFAFSVYILLAAVIGFFAYEELRSITRRLAIVAAADDASNAILEVRRYEKNFLLFRDDRSLGELKKYLGNLNNDLEHIAAQIIRDIGTNDHKMMRSTISEYEKLIGRIAANFQSQQELSAAFVGAGRASEKKLRGNEITTFLVLRRYEKNLLLYKDQPTYETFGKILASLGTSKETERYGILADRLFALFKDERDSVDGMRSKARQIQSLTEELSKREHAQIGAILKRSGNMLLLALFTIVAVGVVVNVKLARSIASPIRDLERATKKVAMGDFSEVIEIKGKDEITSLEISFNQMEDRLKDTLSSLELAVRNLHEKQAQLIDAERLASIGILAAGIAHEINNPLTSVLTFSHLLLEQMPEEDPRREKLKMMARETERARIIVRQLLSFAKETPLKSVTTNINCPINEIIETLAAQGLFDNIEVELNFSDNLPEINADPIKLEQVVLNILLNAIHSITPPGKITVETRARGDFIEIAIGDTGCGIPREHLGKIFDPFYTTKDSTKGAGLGLAVSYGIIKKHGGDIQVESIPDKGTTFIVRLPVHG